MLTKGANICFIPDHFSIILGSFNYVIIGVCFLITRPRMRPRELSRFGSFFLWLTLWPCRMVGSHIQTISLLSWRWLHYYRDRLLCCFFLNMSWQYLFFFFSTQRGATELRDQQAEVDSLKEYSKQEISKLMGQMQESYEDQIKRITEMVLFMLLFLTSKYDMHMCSSLRSGNHF